MKRLMGLAVVLVIGMFVMTVCAMAVNQDKKGPVGKVVSAAVDTTKKVGAVAGDTVGAVSDTAVTVTKDVAGAAGDTVTAVSDTAVTVTKDVAGAAGDTVGAVSDTEEQAETDDTE